MTPERLGLLWGVTVFAGSLAQARSRDCLGWCCCSAPAC